MLLIPDLRCSGENRCFHRRKKSNNQELILLLILEITRINNVKSVIRIEVFWWSFLTVQELEKLQSFDCGKHLWPDQEIFSCKLERDRHVESVRVVRGSNMEVSELWAKEEFSEATVSTLITM